MFNYVHATNIHYIQPLSPGFHLNYAYTNIHYIQPIPELPPHRKQACADSKRDSKITKIIFSVTHITEL
jgi:hypothetical protein